MANLNFSPAVVTSRRAQEHLDDITVKHADLLNGMSQQSQKVAAFNMQKQAELQAENSMKAELEKEKMVADTQAKKDALQFQQKEAELNIKRAALSMGV